MARSECARCHETFTGITAFDKHQTISRGGQLACHPPASRGLVNRDGVWGWPGREGSGDWVSARYGSQKPAEPSEGPGAPQIPGTPENRSVARSGAVQGHSCGGHGPG